MKTDITELKTDMRDVKDRLGNVEGRLENVEYEVVKTNVMIEQDIITLKTHAKQTNDTFDAFGKIIKKKII